MHPAILTNNAAHFLPFSFSLNIIREKIEVKTGAEYKRTALIAAPIRLTAMQNYKAEKHPKETSIKSIGAACLQGFHKYAHRSPQAARYQNIDVIFYIPYFLHHLNILLPSLA